MRAGSPRTVQLAVVVQAGGPALTQLAIVVQAGGPALTQLAVAVRVGRPGPGQLTQLTMPVVQGLEVLCPCVILTPIVFATYLAAPKIISSLDLFAKVGRHSNIFLNCCILIQ